MFAICTGSSLMNDPRLDGQGSDYSHSNPYIHKSIHVFFCNSVSLFNDTIYFIIFKSFSTIYIIIYFSYYYMKLK